MELQHICAEESRFQNGEIPLYAHKSDVVNQIQVRC